MESVHRSDLLPQTTSKTRVTQTLDHIFTEQKQLDKTVVEARDILQTIADELSEEELLVTLTEMQFLCETWLDDFERSIFEGQTLQELLHNKGGA